MFAREASWIESYDIHPLQLLMIENVTLKSYVNEMVKEAHTKMYSFTSLTICQNRLSLSHRYWDVLSEK